MRRNDSEFLKRRREQLAAEKEEKEREETLEAIKELEAAGAEPDEDAPAAIPRDLATAYYEETHSWMHSFGDVRSDKGEYFILHEDNPDAWRMKVGDLIQDVAISPQPYWEVIENDRFRKKRVVLKPIGLNPLLTGIGAGGARITKEDIRVLTGEYEDDRVEQIEELLNSGEAKNIEQVRYILAGTVGVNFGPNGPQGGWYNANDTMANRGGRRRMTADEIVVHDAEALRKFGFAVPYAAIDGEITPYEWSAFIENPPGMFKNWEDVPPTDTASYYERMMEFAVGLFGEDDWRIQSWSDRLLSWQPAIDIVHEDGVFSFEELALDTRAALAHIVAKDRGLTESIAKEVPNRLKEITTWVLFSVPGEDAGSISSIVAHLQHPQAEVQMRAACRCMMCVMSSDDADGGRCYKALHDFIKNGHGHWLVNEQIINWCGRHIKDRNLLVDATKLPDGTNRKYAYWQLGNMQDKYLLDAVFTEDNAEALSGIVSALMQDGYRGFFRGGPRGFKGYLPGRHVTYYLLEKLTSMLNDDESVFTRYHASETLKTVIRYANAQGFDVSAADAALSAYEQGSRRNPPEPSAEEDAEWLELAREHMLAVVSDED